MITRRFPGLRRPCPLRTFSPTRMAGADYPNVTFVQASVAETGLAPESFDLIVAFEVIEHLKDWRVLLAEARRLLTADGVFLVSTPNRAYYNESRGESGANSCS